MIEELKLLLDEMSNVPDVALWILGGFLLYKLVTYLSMTGAVVYVTKLICTSAVAYKNTPKEVTFQSILMGEDVATALLVLLRGITSSAYVHRSHIEELQKAWDAWQRQKLKK